MDPGRQTQELLAVSASMRTALLVYSGITVKMMVDADLGAVLSTMFMVQYEPDGAAGPHDHPFEETYLFLEGTVDATFDGEEYRLEPGDVAWAGVGCVHSFRNGDGTGAVAGDPGAAAAGAALLPVRPRLGLPAQRLEKETADEDRGDRRHVRHRARGRPAPRGARRRGRAHRPRPGPRGRGRRGGRRDGARASPST